MQLDQLDDLYRQAILDHYHTPRNPQQVAEAQIQAEGNNPFCGDAVALQVKLSNIGTIQEIGSQAQGCAICQASASMLTEALKGKTLEEAQTVNRTLRRLTQGKELSGAELKALGDLEALQGVRKSPVRIKCVLLAWSILEEGIEEYQSKRH